MYRNGLLLLTTLTLAVEPCLAVSNSHRVSIELVGSVMHDQPTFNLGDVAIVTGKSKEAIARLKSMPLGNSPKAGYSVSINRQIIQSKIHTSYPQLSPQVEWQGAKVAKLQSVGVILDTARLIKQAKLSLEKYLDEYFEKYKVAYSGKIKQLHIPNTEYTLSTREIRSLDISKRTCVWVDIFIDKKRYESIPVWFSVTITDNAFVSIHKINKGETLYPNDFLLNEVDITEAFGTPISDRKDVIDMRAKRTLLRNTILTQSDIEPVPLVQRHANITIMAVHNNVSVHVKGKALEDGILNQTINVKTNRSNEKIRALVIDKDQVKVE